MKLYGATQGGSRELLARAVKLSCQLDRLPDIRIHEGGKPYFPAYPALHFSLSHSGGLLLCAVDTRPLGVDIERIVPRREALPAYALSPAEFQRYRLLGGGWPAFYALWTKKEAWCKYTGRGLGESFRETPPEEGLFYRAYVHEDWCATVCGESPPPEEIQWLEPEDTSWQS